MWSPRPAAAFLAGILLSATAAFGAVHLVSAGVSIIAVAILSVGAGWQRAGSASLRLADTMLLASFGLVLFQMVPLPAAIVAILSPAREGFARATSLTPGHANFATLTLSVPATAHAASSLAAIVMTYWTARSLFARGGIRTFAMIMAWGAIAFSVVAVAQHAAATPFVYGFWQPRDAGARPLGPFVNRNHFGTWGIMATCLCLGYLQWRGHKPSRTSLRTRMVEALDGRSIVLQLAVALVAAVVALGASRSSLVALLCAAGSFAFFAWRVQRVRDRLSLLLLAVFAAGAMLVYGDPGRLLLRLDETRDRGVAARAQIWRDAFTAFRDYTLTGVGAGAFAHAMRIYQTTPRTYYHNEAHNQYVQILTEGGVLLTALAVVGLLAFVVAARARLRRRDDPLRWMRLASASALVGIAVQSLWETGLTLPANGMFAAALAGLLVHESEPTPEGEGRRELR